MIGQLDLTGHPSIYEIPPPERTPELARLLRHTAHCQDCIYRAPCQYGVALARKWLDVARRP